MDIYKRNVEHLDSMTIGGGHTMLAGYIPNKISPEEFSSKFFNISNKTPETISEFGLFGSDIDYNTFYPDLNPEDLTPQDTEFIEPMFRLLSATIVSKNYNPTDFSKNGVLKASMPLLLGQTVNCDHETNIGNAIGAVSKVVWQDAYKYGNFTIPAGINGILKIDGKANPRIARGIMMDPPSIHSNSVTVSFKWDKSHPNLSDEDFYRKLGSYDDKGVMVCRVVTEVVRYLETSLVSHGADTFAQKIGKDGKIVNPEFAKRTYNSYSEYIADEDRKYYSFDCKSEFSEVVENNDTCDSNNNNEIYTNQNSDEKMDELKNFFQSLIDNNIISLSEGAELNEETVINSLTEIIATSNSKDSQIVSLNERVADLEASVQNLTPLYNVGVEYVKALREETVNTYNKLKGSEADSTIINMLNSETTGINTVKSLKEEFQAQLEQKFPLKCSKCGSSDINRASSAAEVETTATVSNEEQYEPISTEQAITNIYHRKMSNNK